MEAMYPTKKFVIGSLTAVSSSKQWRKINHFNDSIENPPWSEQL